MKKLTVSLVWVFLLGLSSCIGTSYGPRNYKGGYSEVLVAEDMYLLQVSGNAYADKTLIREYYLYRAAELTLGQGKKYFVLYEDQNFSRPVKIYALTPYQGISLFVFSGTRHFGKGYLRMHEEKPEDAVIAYNAALIADQLKDRFIESPKRKRL